MSNSDELEKIIGVVVDPDRKEKLGRVMLPHLLLMTEAKNHDLALMKLSIAAAEGVPEIDVATMYNGIQAEYRRHHLAMDKVRGQAEELLYMLAGGRVAFDDIQHFKRAMASRGRYQR